MPCGPKQAASSGVYDSVFFSEQIEGSMRSASAVIPLILETFPDTHSVVDIGCGAGGWLSVFRQHGVLDILGIDGSDAGSLLQIPRDSFRELDLEKDLGLDRRFDLALSLEVAEHLSPERGAGFVADLCEFADVVIFSAAIPGQGGTHHIHEQWQAYWVSLFEKEGYVIFDVLRPRVWSDPRVERWYAQNILCFVLKSRIVDFPTLLSHEKTPSTMLNLVHPAAFCHRVQSEEAHCAQIEHLHDQNKGLRLGYEFARSENQILCSKMESLKSEVNALRREARRVEAKYAAVTRSSSWRLTAPFRFVSRRLKELRKGSGDHGG